MAIDGTGAWLGHVIVYDNWGMKGDGATTQPCSDHLGVAAICLALQRSRRGWDRRSRNFSQSRVPRRFTVIEVAGTNEYSSRTSARLFAMRNVTAAPIATPIRHRHKQIEYWVPRAWSSHYRAENGYANASGDFTTEPHHDEQKHEPAGLRPFALTCAAILLDNFQMMRISRCLTPECR